MKINKLLIIGFASILLASVGSAKGKGAKRSFDKVDANEDGKISEIEFVAGAEDEEKAAKRFNKKDADTDGFLSKKEFAKKGKCKKGPKHPKKKKKKKAE